jgi:hypothetical protein
MMGKNGRIVAITYAPGGPSGPRKLRLSGDVHVSQTWFRLTN